MTDAAAAPAAPRAASTILLLRDGPSGLEVFMVVRHHEIDFASGALVFPGGRMEAADAELAREAMSFADGIDETARALRIAAIREAFEECGVLLARPKGDERIVSAERLSALDRSAPFADLMAREGLVPAADALVPFARWITPAFLPKRFDTHFFLALAPPHRALAHDGREAVEFDLDCAQRRAGGAGGPVQAPVPDRAELMEARPPRQTPPPRWPPRAPRRSSPSCRNGVRSTAARASGSRSRPVTAARHSPFADCCELRRNARHLSFLRVANFERPARRAVRSNVCASPAYEGFARCRPGRAFQLWTGFDVEPSSDRDLGRLNWAGKRALPLAKRGLPRSRPTLFLLFRLAASGSRVPFSLLLVVVPFGRLQPDCASARVRFSPIGEARQRDARTATEAALRRAQNKWSATRTSQRCAYSA